MIQEAIRCRDENRREVILFNLCGHGMLDLAAYERYLRGDMKDTENGD